MPVPDEYARRSLGSACLVNTYGRGPANAIRFGIDARGRAGGRGDDGRRHATTRRRSTSWPRLVERGVAVAAASRYMAGGQQVGGPRVKGLLSALAGRSLRLLAHVGTRDATNSFKAYSTRFRPRGRHRLAETASRSASS